MKQALIMWAAVLAMASTGCTQEQNASATAASRPASLEQLPAVTAAQAFADSIAAMPHASAADKAAAAAYVQTVTNWQESKLKSSIKDHPCMANTWSRYRYVLRTVVKSRSYPAISPEDAKKWESFVPQCETVAKMLLPLIDEPDLSPTQAVGSLINVESGMGNVKFAAERYLMYLEHPQTRAL